MADLGTPQLEIVHLIRSDAAYEEALVKPSPV
jgi:hypothetical protein